jgi:hypothetical protein
VRSERALTGGSPDALVMEGRAASHRSVRGHRDRERSSKVLDNEVVRGAELRHAAADGGGLGSYMYHVPLVYAFMHINLHERHRSKNTSSKRNTVSSLFALITCRCPTSVMYADNKRTAKNGLSL